MFGSTSPFGQSSSSPFGSQSVFGQTSSATSNPFAPKPFGSTSPFGSQAGGSSPFGSQTGGSIFGGTSTGVFGATQSSSPLGSTPAFGASSTPAFGSSAPAFGASSTPAFGSSSPFGGSSVFGQKPAFGGFGSSPSQTSPFGSAFQQTQSAFGSNLFGSSTPFGASTPTFGASSAPAFGATTSTPAFGATTSTPAFGASSTPAFGSTGTPAFGSTSSVFGASSTPTFGSTPFGASSTPAFGASSTPAFGASSTPAFGATNTSAFGASTPSFSFGSTPAFGQTSSAFGSSPFGTTPSPFGAQSSPFGSQTTTATFGTPGFGQPGFSGQPGGSRVAPYSPTSEVDGTSGTQPAGKLESISAMPIYKDKSHEELRWEDYQRGDKGGPNPASQSASVLSFGSPAQSNPFGASTSSAFSQTSANPFASSTSSNPFAPKPQTFGHSGFGATSASAFSTPFSAASTSPFGAASTTPSLFGSASTTAFGAGSSPSLFGASSTPAFGSSSSIFGSASAPASTPSFGSSLTFGNTQSTGLFSSSTPLGQTTSAFGQTGSAFGQGMSAFGQTNPFSTPPSGFGGNLFASSSAPSILGSSPAGFGQATPSLSTPFQPAPLGQTTSAFSFGNIGQTQPASGGFGATSSGFGQGIFGQSSAPTQSNIIMQPTAISNPFGTLPAMPQLSIGHAGSAPSVQYGISSMPVSDKPAPARISALATPRHLSQRRIKLPARKYHPRKDGPMIPFFSNDEETPSTPKADALFLPRENPRSLVVRPVDQWPSRTNGERQSLSKDVPTPVHENGKIPEGLATQNGYNSQEHDKISAENGFNKQEDAFPGKSTPKLNGDTTHKGDSYIPISGHRAGEAAIVYEHGADIEALMPKLRHSDYYTEPRIQELAAKERAEPGYCRHVKDFVVGRHGYGGIKFLGETDVRRLDLESIVQFNMREVIVYLDESKKPPIGQGLNKPAEVTLLNIKGSNKKTGEQYTHGPKLDKYKEMLKKKTEDQGAEFLSYDPGKGEWKFKVDHFSQYSLAGEGDLLACCSLDLCVDE